MAVAFKEVLGQVIEWLQQDGRVSYRSVKRQFDLNDDYFEDLQEALLYTHAEVVDDDGRGFVWTGEPCQPFPDAEPDTDKEIRFQTIFLVVRELLQPERRITYRSFKHRLGIDESLLAENREELCLTGLPIDVEDKVLVWTGTAQPTVSDSTQFQSSTVSEQLNPESSGYRPEGDSILDFIIQGQHP